MATLDEILERAANTPNADIDCFPAASDFTEAKVAVSVGVTRYIDPVDAGVGMTTPGSDGPVYMGIGQNAPITDGPSVVRVSGITKVLYGATIAVGDRLKLDGATSRVVPFDCATGDGHTHARTPAIVRRVVYLTDDLAGPIAGATLGNFTATLEWDDAGSILTASETVTMSEIGGGRYLASFTPDQFAMYILTIEYEDGGVKGIVTPPGFQFDAPSYGGAPVELSLKMIVGRALVAGVDGDEGLMLIQPQIF